MIASLPSRIRAKIGRRKDGCWIWTGGDSGNGYGKVWFEGRLWMSHRLVWRLLKGEIPEGQVLDHLCRNRGCCNPAHLEPVSVRENTHRGNAVLFPKGCAASALLVVLLSIALGCSGPAQQSRPLHLFQFQAAETEWAIASTEAQARQLIAERYQVAAAEISGGIQLADAEAFTLAEDPDDPQTSETKPVRDWVRARGYGFFASTYR